MKIAEKMIHSSWSRFIYFRNYRGNKIPESEILVEKPNIIATLEQLNRSDEVEDMRLMNHFWGIMDSFYQSFQKLILENNKSGGIFSKSHTKRAQRSYFKKVLPTYKPIPPEKFPDLQERIAYLFQEKSNLSKSIPINFYYHVKSQDSIPEVGMDSEGSIVIVISRNIVTMLREEPHTFDAVFLHEAAHIIQNDTHFFFREHFLKKKIIHRTYFEWYGTYIILWALIFGGLYFFSDDEFSRSTVRKAPNMLIREIIKFSIFAFIGVHIFKKGLTKKNRVRSEFGADIYSMLMCRNFQVLHILRANPRHLEESRMHLSNKDRIDQLQVLLSYVYLLARRTFSNKE